MRDDHDHDAAGHRPGRGRARTTRSALLRQHKVEKLPLVDDGGRLRGLITVKDFTKSEQYPHATKDDAGRLRVAAAVGVGDDALQAGPRR